MRALSSDPLHSYKKPSMGVCTYNPNIRRWTQKYSWGQSSSTDELQFMSQNIRWRATKEDTDAHSSPNTHALVTDEIYMKSFRIHSLKGGQVGHSAGVGVGTVAARDGQTLAACS